MDPLDGGVNARILFLFEKPGPMTDASDLSRNSGSGFISRDNDDRTAEATFQFMREARIPRRETLIWNVIPWWNGMRKISSTEMNEGLHATGALIQLLDNLRVIVLVGKKAGKAYGSLVELDVSVYHSDHPSPLVKAKFPQRWSRIPADWVKAARNL
jgi:hypothetical protein